MKSRKYIIDGLDCANCAMKVEKAIAKLKGVEKVTLNFSTKTLSLQSEIAEDKLFELLKKTIDGAEDGTTLLPYSKQHSKEHHSHVHGGEHHHEHDSCQCGHEHNEEHHSKHENEKIEKSKKSICINKNAINWIFILSAIALLAVGLIGSACGIAKIIADVFMAASAVAAGLQIVWSGVKSVLHKRLDEKVLTAVAVVAAVCIGEYFEAAMVSILFLLGEMLENHAVEASRRDIEKLSEIRPDVANLVLENGSIYAENAEDISVGSTILIKPHERIPLDGVVLSGTSTLDTSALTGESLPREIAVGEEVLSGMMNLDGELYVRTTKECDDSAAARILRLVEESAAHKGSSEKFISRFASVYTPIIMVCAVLLTLVPPLFGWGEILDWLNRALVFLVASCPCALVISVPLGFYAGIGAASKRGVLIKGGKFIEALAHADAVAFDKTGTLTSGRLSVTKVKTIGNHTENEILALAAAAEKMSVHPVAEAIRREAEERGLELPNLSDYKEKAGCGVMAHYDGHKLQCGNHRLFDSADLKNGVIYLSYDKEIIGEIHTADTLREDSPEIISKLKQAGLKKIVMLTGDSVENAEKIAHQCGIEECHAALLPHDKAEWVQNIHENHTVLFVGDGINDAPVLACADCGVAMGFGSEAAIEAADAVLSNGTLSGLPEAISVSRKILRIVKANIVFALSVKAIILILAVLGIAPMWLAVIADTGVSVLSVLNSARILKK